MFNFIGSKLGGDRTIWIIVILLSVFSMLAVYSSSGTLAARNGTVSTEYFFIKHTLILFIGLGITYAMHLVNHVFFSRIAQILLYTSVPLLLFTLLFGTNINDANRWLSVPVIKLTFQTSDLAKLSLIMYTARMLSRKQDIINDFDRAFKPIILPIIAVCLLIVPANLSTAALLFFTCLIIMFIGRVPVKYITMSLWGGLSIFAIFVLIMLALGGSGRIETWKNRLTTFTGVAENNSDSNVYQVEQSKIAIANGGLIRIAPGKSTQSNFLPQAYSDFIYAIIIEEYGLLGGFLVLILYLLFLFQSIKIFIKSPGAFGALLAVGLSISLTIQALMNMAVTVNLLPVTGLTLPLISMGGSSLLFTSVAIGIILSVSRDIEKISKQAIV